MLQRWILLESRPIHAVYVWGRGLADLLLQITQLRVIDRIVLCPPTMWYRRERDPDISRWPPWSSRVSFTRGWLEGSMIGWRLWRLWFLHFSDVLFFVDKRRLVFWEKLFLLARILWLGSIPERRESWTELCDLNFDLILRISMSTLWNDENWSTSNKFCFSTTVAIVTRPQFQLHSQPLIKSQPILPKCAGYNPRDAALSPSLWWDEFHDLCHSVANKHLESVWIPL